MKKMNNFRILGWFLLLSSVWKPLLNIIDANDRILG